MRAVVYKHFSQSGELLYVGSTVNLGSRFYDHKRLAPWFNEIATITIQHFETEQQARDEEKICISHSNPRENIVHNYIRIPNSASDKKEKWEEMVGKERTDEKVLSALRTYSLSKFSSNKEMARYFGLKEARINAILEGDLAAPQSILQAAGLK